MNTEVSGANADVAGHGAKVDLATICDEPKPWWDSLLDVNARALNGGYLHFLEK